MLTDFFSYVWSLVWSWLGLLAGSAGAALALYERAKKQEVHPRRYVMVLIAFVVVAGFLAWREEHKKIQQLNQEIAGIKRKDLPELKGSVNQVGFYEPPDSDDYYVNLYTTIYNIGAPSIVRGWWIKAKVPGRKDVEGELVYVPNPVYEMLQDKAVANPIPTGGQVAGHVVFKFHRQQLSPEALVSANLELIFADIHGRVYTVETVMVGQRIDRPLHIPGITEPESSTIQRPRSRR